MLLDTVILELVHYQVPSESTSCHLAPDCVSIYPLLSSLIILLVVCTAEGRPDDGSGHHRAESAPIPISIQFRFMMHITSSTCCFHLCDGQQAVLIDHSQGPCSFKYEAYNRKTFMNSITLQPLVADQAFMPHMKAMYVPFHMGYGSLICY